MKNKRLGGEGGRGVNVQGGGKENSGGGRIEEKGRKESVREEGGYGKNAGVRG